MIFGVTLLTFFIFNVVGGDPAFQLAGKNATPEQIESFRQELGLNKPLFFQYLDFLNQILFFDWGHSWHTRENINQMILNGIGPSLSLSLPAFSLSILISLSIAIFSAFAHEKYKVLDQSITTVCLAMMSISFLVYIICFQYFLSFRMGFFEINGWDSNFFGRWKFLYLPWIIWISAALGPHVLIFRTALLDEASADYVRTAHAKGLDRFSLYFKHILKNALIPISTVVIMQIPFVITGSLLLEAFFGIPGLGHLLIQAIQTADFPVVKAFTVIGSLIYLFFNLVSDLVYIFVDPRVELK